MFIKFWLTKIKLFGRDIKFPVLEIMTDQLWISLGPHGTGAGYGGFWICGVRHMLFGDCYPDWAYVWMGKGVQ